MKHCRLKLISFEPLTGLLGPAVELSEEEALLQEVLAVWRVKPTPTETGTLTHAATNLPQWSIYGDRSIRVELLEEEGDRARIKVDNHPDLVYWVHTEDLIIPTEAEAREIATIDYAGEQTEKLYRAIEILRVFLEKNYFENYCQTIIECHECGIGLYEEQIKPHPDNWKMLAHDEGCPCFDAVSFLREIGHWEEWRSD